MRFGVKEILCMIRKESEASQEERRCRENGQELLKLSMQGWCGLVQLERGMKMEDKREYVLWEMWGYPVKLPMLALAGVLK